MDLRLVLPATAMWAGALCCLVSGVGSGGRLWTAGVGLLVAVITGCAVRQRRQRVAALVAAGFLLGCLLAGCAMLRATRDPVAAAAAHGRYAELVMRVAAEPVALPGRPPQVPIDDVRAGPESGDPAARYRISAMATELTVAGQSTPSDLQVSIIGTGAAFGGLRVGSIILVRGVLSPDAFPVLPAAQLRATSAPQLIRAPPAPMRVAAVIRSDLAAVGASLGGDAGALLPGLVVGDTSAISQRLSADARATGLTHLLAVSGSHFTLVCGGLMVLVRRLAGPRVAAVAGALTLSGLVVLVGPEPSVLRACVMGAIGVLAVFVGRGRTVLPALGAAIGLLVALDPAIALSAGFALSVTATAGIVLLAPGWIAALRDRRWPAGWAGLVCIPAAATLATLPVAVALSGAISLASIPANILAAPVVPPALLLGLVVALIGPIWPAAGHVLATAIRPLLDYLAWIAHTLARWPAATIGYSAQLSSVLLLVGGVIGAGLLLRNRRARLIVTAVLIGAGVVLIPAQVAPAIGWPPAGWLIAGCEVGQGDGFVLATDDQRSAVVVDTGPDPALMDACLNHLRVSTIPLLILTHLHADHIDGLTGVLHGRSVGMIGVGPDREPGPAWDRVLQSAAGAGVPVVQLSPGYQFAAAGLDLQVLAPRDAFHGSGADVNNDSVVLVAQRAGVRMLMTGDVELLAQQRLLAARVDLRADILKVPHHGSAKDEPAFLRAVGARVALIGVGRGNDYGHPSPALLARLREVGIGTVLRTDTDGDIAVALQRGALVTANVGARLPP